MSDESGQQTQIDAELERPAERAPTAVEVGRAKVAELEGKIASFSEKIAANREARAQTKPDDRQALNGLHSEALRFNLQLEDSVAWLAQARTELADLERAELIAADVELAKQRLLAARHLRAGGKALDEGLSAERLRDWVELADFVHSTRLSHEANGPAPNGQQLRVFAAIAVRTMLMSCPLIAREFESVAPGQRMTFAKISNDWSLAAERSAKEFLERVGVEFVDAA
jgi:hypothetical protein